VAGTLFGLPLSQQMDLNGTPMAGCLLYVYEGGTTTPADAYSDTGLSNLLPFPLTADSNGRLPQFWLADGTYRARLTTSTGVLQFDTDSILAIGASSGGGGGGSTVDEDAIFQTGDWSFRLLGGSRPGWVRLIGRTIGSSTSGATERANADTQALYEYLWANFTNTLVPVTGGRGANAAADWAANKPMGLFDCQTRGIAGADAGGGGFSGVTLTYGAATDGGAQGGETTNTLSIAKLPAVTPAGTVAITDPGHPHTLKANGFQMVTGGTGIFGGGGGTQYGQGDGITSTATTGITAAFTGTSFGSGEAHNNMPPFILGTHYMKL
jgi:hypothetical protein